MCVLCSVGVLRISSGVSAAAHDEYAAVGCDARRWPSAHRKWLGRSVVAGSQCASASCLFSAHSKQVAPKPLVLPVTHSDSVWPRSATSPHAHTTTHAVSTHSTPTRTHNNTHTLGPRGRARLLLRAHVLRMATRAAAGARRLMRRCHMQISRNRHARPGSLFHAQRKTTRRQHVTPRSARAPALARNL